MIVSVLGVSKVAYAVRVVSEVTFTGSGLGSATAAAFLNLIAYEISFDSVAPVDMIVSYTGSGIILLDTRAAGVVFNHTGVNWTDYHFDLGTGSGSSFIPSTPSDGLGFTGTPLSIGFHKLGQTEDSLFWSGGLVPAHGSCFVCAAAFVFAVNVPANLTQFTIREFPTTVPEPSNWILLGFGFAGLGMWRRLRGD
jgi:hypothetical protein